MTNDEFNEIVEEFLTKVKSLLMKKTAEYAGDVNELNDRLECFKHAAAISKTTPEKALYGFWLKHITSIADMISSGERFTLDRWLEKLLDNTNYGILLYALLQDEGHYIQTAEEMKSKQPKINTDLNKNTLRVEPAFTINNIINKPSINEKQNSHFVNTAIKREKKNSNKNKRRDRK